jgi:hypothetical protein
MKKHFFFISFTLIFTTIYSQNIDFKLNQGEGIRLKGSTAVTETQELGVIDNYAYFLMKPFQTTAPNAIVLMNQNNFIYKFDLNNNLIKTKELEMTQDKKELDFEGAMRLQKNIFVFSSFQNKRDKKHYLFVQNYNTSTDALTTNAKLIAELDYSEYSKFNNTTFEKEVSPDSSKVLIFYSLVTKKNEVLRSGINVYDREMNLLWKNDNVTAQFSEGYFEFLKFKVSNTGEVYLLGEHFAEKVNYWDAAQFRSRGFFSKDTYNVDKPNYAFRVYHYTDKTAKVEGYTFELPKKFIRDINIQPSDNGNVLCSGVYSDPGKVSVAGTFCFEFNTATQTIENKSTLDFGKELLTKDLNAEELKLFRRSIDNKQEWDPYGYIISDIKTKQNGDKYFIAEQYISGLHQASDGKNTYYQLIHLYNDIYIVNLNKQNQISKVDKIAKRQFWLDDYKYSSYKLIEKNNNLYFFFNTFEKSKKLAYNTDVLDSFIVRLDVNGSQTRAIFKTKEDLKQPLPMLLNSMQISDNSILFCTFPMSFSLKAELSFQQIKINE